MRTDYKVTQNWIAKDAVSVNNTERFEIGVICYGAASVVRRRPLGSAEKSMSRKKKRNTGRKRTAKRSKTGSPSSMVPFRPTPPVMPSQPRMLTTVKIDLENAPIPARRYQADAAWIDYRGNRVSLVVGQAKLFGEEYRSLVVVKMSPDSIHRFLQNCREFWPHLGEFLKKNELEASPIERPKEEPSQTVALAANVIQATHTNLDAALDFYYVDPIAVRKAAQGLGTLTPEPVLRVDLAVELLASVIGELYALQEKLPKETS